MTDMGGGDGGGGGFGDGGFGEPLGGADQGPRGRAFFRGGNPGDLIIIQTPEIHAEVEDLLKELRRAMHIQVNVELRFLDIGADFFEEIGFEFDEIQFNPPGNPFAPDVSIGSGIPQFSDESSDVGMDVNFSIFDSFSLTGFFRAVQTHSDAKTLANPILTLMNGQRGYLLIETTKNYVRTFSVEDNLLVPEIETISDMIALDVRPIVSADRKYVYFELAPQVTTFNFDPDDIYTFQSSVTTSADDDDTTTVVENVIQIPTQASRSFEVTVCVPDRGILMVGGLSQFETQSKESGVPVLNKIPLIKRLFLQEGKRISRNTLLILLRPRIIIMPEEEDQAF